MNAGVWGLVWCFTFVILEAAQAVFFGGVFQRMDAFLIGFLVFGLTTIVSIVWTYFRNAEQLWIALDNRASLIGLNVTAAGGWLAYLISVQLIEPAVAFMIFSGAVPITTILAAHFGVPEASPVRNRFEALGNIVMLLGMVSLAVFTVLGWSGFVRGGIAVAVAGIFLAGASGALITGMLFFGYRLDRRGVGPVAQFGLRFILYIVLSLSGFALGLDNKGPVPINDILYAVAIGLLIMAFPIYGVQKAIRLVSSLTIATVTALGPLFVFAFQLIEGRVGYAETTLLGLSIYLIGSMVAATGSTRAAPHERRSSV